MKNIKKTKRLKFLSCQRKGDHTFPYLNQRKNHLASSIFYIYKLVALLLVTSIKALNLMQTEIIILV